jgi:hypothetical protein
MLEAAVLLSAEQHGTSLQAGRRDQVQHEGGEYHGRERLGAESPQRYPSGHMMYLRAEDIVTSNQDIRDFMTWSSEATQGPTRI